MKRIWAVVLSLCLLLCFPVAVAAEDEDLISHYNGDDVEYLRFLINYFYEKYWDSSDMAVYCAGLEMAKLLNEYKNDLSPHPFLRGELDEETGEITITGIQVTEFCEYTTMDIANYYNPAHSSWYFELKSIPANLVIPDEFNGHPVTKIADGVFAEQHGLREITIGKNVREIGDCAFMYCPYVTKIHSWGDSLTTIGDHAFSEIAYNASPADEKSIPSELSDTLEYIGDKAFAFTAFEKLILPRSMKKLYANFLCFTDVTQLIILSKDIEIDETEVFGPPDYDNYIHVENMYCYSGSTFEQFALRHRFSYALSDGDSLLWDGEAVEGNELNVTEGMTEAELRSHLSIDGTSSEIRIDGLEDGKVVNGTTVTLFHTVAQAPGKVYTVTVERTPGDADGDGTFTLVDVAQLVRYLAGGWDVELDVSNVDVNDDGAVNLKDAVLMRRYLAGWDVTLE